MYFKTIAAVVVALTATPAFAQERTPQSAMRIAVESRMCGDLKVLRAEWRRGGNIGVLCEGAVATYNTPVGMGEATNFVPLIGGLGPLLGLGGGAAVIGALSRGSSTSDTQ